MSTNLAEKLVSQKEVLTIRDLSFSFKNQIFNTIQNLSLSVFEGEIISILGSSGCGKTTLLNLIAGLLEPKNGKIEITNYTKQINKIGYIFQEDTLLPWRTVKSNLALAKEISGIASEIFEKNQKDFLNSFHLDERIFNKYPAQLSGGMKQRINIIQTLLFNPSILLLDEPFSALDFYTKLSLETEFYNLVKTKKITALLVTHDIEEAIALSDRIILLNRQGKIETEIAISFRETRRTPEYIRCLPEFRNYYTSIWEIFKGIMRP